ncbi:MAG: gamma-glutamyltransferase [Betaproteobacteria bacterium]|nr:gamma-glutamyltransferase [Betaproteobacteria bacterium]
MNDYFSRSQLIRKPAVSSKGGIVAAQHRRAAQVGAEVLEAGGDAVDAAVATSFAIGVVEPWMSGLAAGGAMVLWRASEQKAYAVDYGMRAPRALDPAHYPLAGTGRASDLLPWPAVKDDRNLEGATAVAVPGVVAGMALAHERMGRIPWRELVEPAVGLAREGMLLDWYSGLLIASNARALSRDSDAARLFLEEGRWPPLGTWTGINEKRLDQRTLAASLEQVAREGAGALYGGELGRALARDVQAKGGSLSEADFGAYHAEIRDALQVPYRGGRVHVAPGMTGGPTLAQALKRLSAIAKPSYSDYAKALDLAWRERLAASGDRDESSACTTHFSVVDRHGNLCAVTQTLLSIFGSRVVSASTGIPLNNGIMWFDPEPGKPNSLAPGKRCLGNYCPIVGEAADGRLFALGASGGRKIVGTVLQLASFLLDDAASLEEAFHRPRIDVSGEGRIVADQTLPRDVLAALQEVLPTVAARRTHFPYSFAVPAGVLREGDANSGCTEIMSPWGDAVAERGR